MKQLLGPFAVVLDVQGYLPKDIPAAKFWSFTGVTHAQEARRIRQRPQLRTQMARRQSISVHPSLQTRRTATGYRPCPARAGSRFCVSIVRSDHSSQSGGDRARSKSCSDNESQRSLGTKRTELLVANFRLSIQKGLAKRTMNRWVRGFGKEPIARHVCALV
jgi:hypothetical protein